MNRKRTWMLALLAAALTALPVLPAAADAGGRRSTSGGDRAGARHDGGKQRAHRGARARHRARAAAKLVDCERSGRTSQRSLTVVTKMRRVRGTRWMEERVDLLRHRPHEAGYTTMAQVPGLGEWKTPNPVMRHGVLQPFVGTYRLYTTVNNLNVVPAAYRIKATFRWHGRGDEVLRVRRRYSGVCFQTADGGEPASRSRRHHKRPRSR